ncbi:hypothetical protein GQ55_5G034600 [Panicum hallii var. hallii]|uniref:Uncharacterized protein n=1 Tax=Panicum hallii var. hallii TaxID=1504633 RepID=A0A2T7DC80_9POAL|nr:hypothetical protein GQ55_5G034600 [Panicum hallii var. hallii]
MGVRRGRRRVQVASRGRRGLLRAVTATAAAAHDPSLSPAGACIPSPWPAATRGSVPRRGGVPSLAALMSSHKGGGACGCYGAGMSARPARTAPPLRCGAVPGGVCAGAIPDPQCGAQRSSQPWRRVASSRQDIWRTRRWRSSSSEWKEGKEGTKSDLQQGFLYFLLSLVERINVNSYYFGCAQQLSGSNGFHEHFIFSFHF